MSSMKIAIDAGHGMSNRRQGIYDPGAVRTKNAIEYQEATIVMDGYSIPLKEELTQRGMNVFMLRKNHNDHTPVTMRARMAKTANCDAMVSLHLNAFDHEQAHGLEVLYGKLHDRSLAKKIQKALVGVTHMRDRGVKHRPNLAVFNFEKPTVLIELGFITNDSDLEKILNPGIRAKVVKAIADVLVEHFDHSKTMQQAQAA